MKAAALTLLFAGAAGAQTMLDQEQRLIELHCLLLELQPVGPPGLRPLETSIAIEAIGIPTIDGTTGSKKQITASDRTNVFPRPRVTMGLPAPDGFQAWAGLAYIPPIAIKDVSSHFLGGDLGLAKVFDFPLLTGLRAHLQYAHSKAPVTDPNTRDELNALEYGVDLSAAYRFDLGKVKLSPFAALSISGLQGDFTVTSDAAQLSSHTVNPGITGGVTLLAGPGVQAMAQVLVYPGRMVHPTFSVAWNHDWAGQH